MLPSSDYPSLLDVCALSGGEYKQVVRHLKKTKIEDKH